MNSITPIPVPLTGKEKIFARLHENRVVEVVDDRITWPSGFMKLCVEITGLEPSPALDWVYDPETGKFAAPEPYVPTRQQQMNQAIYDGLAVVSASIPGLSATYHATGPRWQMMRDEMVHIGAFGEFSGGFKELAWKAMSGDVTFVATAQFLSVVKALSGRITQWQAFVDATGASPPAGPVTIA